MSIRILPRGRGVCVCVGGGGEQGEGKVAGGQQKVWPALRSVSCWLTLD